MLIINEKKASIFHKNTDFSSIVISLFLSLIFKQLIKKRKIDGDDNDGKKIADDLFILEFFFLFE